MATMTMIQAIRSAMDVMLERDDNVVVFGEDVGYFGGVFRCTDGLQAKYGTSRVFDTPIAEGGIVGDRRRHGRVRPAPGAPRSSSPTTSIPATTRSSPRPRACATARAGDFTAPLTIRMPCGGGIYGGQTHSQSPEALFTHVCGLRTVMPSNPHDAKGLLIAVDRVRRPGDLPRAQAPLQRSVRRPPRPADRAVVRAPARRGARGPLHGAARIGGGASGRATALTVLTYGTMVCVAEAAARETGIDAEIIDLRSLWPLDLDTIVGSVNKTGRCVIVHEATRTSGFGAELAALVQEHCFFHLEAPIERVTGWDTPYPHAQEWAYFPGPDRVGGGAATRAGDLTWDVHVVKVPDIGEGIAEVELVEWHVAVGRHRASRTRCSPT